MSIKSRRKSLKNDKFMKNTSYLNTDTFEEQFH